MCRVPAAHLGWDWKVHEDGLVPRVDPVHLDHLAWESLDPRVHPDHLASVASTPFHPVDLQALQVPLDLLDHLLPAWVSLLAE